MRNLIFFSVVVALVVFVTGCGVQVQTGTQEDAVEGAERRADQMRSSWASRLQSASPVGMADMVATRIDSTAAMFVGFGNQVVDEWRRANRGRGVDVPASEMRDVVNAWVEEQRPILYAHEDNISQGVQMVEETNFFDRSILDRLNSMVQQYDEIYSVVFFPNGTVEEYNDAIIRERSELVRHSDEFRRQLDGYR